MKHDQSLNGLFCATLAYLTWGLSPVYFKSLAIVPPFEILMHRMIWSFLFLMLLIFVKKRFHALKIALTSRNVVGILFFTTLLVGSNWFLFIWSINNGHILFTSLGYYINPLVNVLLGMIFLKERLRRLQVAAVIIAFSGVLYMTLSVGQFPWISITLAISFGLYGLIRKVAPVEALEGLAIETFILSFPALAYLIYLDTSGSGALFRMSLRIDVLLAGTAMVTGFPLLLFTIGARKLKLITIGFLQYIAPSCTFLLAIFIYKESFAQAQAITFSMIWLALAIFSMDAVWYYHSNSRALINGRIQDKLK